MSNSITIKRTKAYPIFGLLLFVTITPIFLFSGIAILANEKTSDLFTIIFAFFFILISLYMIVKAINPTIKICSSLPEFEISSREFRIYNKPNYSSMPLKDIIGCEVYYTYVHGKNITIGLSLKENSYIEGNSTKLQGNFQNIPKEINNVIFLNLELANIEPEELKQIILNKISINQN